MSCVPVTTLILINPRLFASIALQSVFTCAVFFPDSIFKRITNNRLALIFIYMMRPCTFCLSCVYSRLCSLRLNLDLSGSLVQKGNNSIIQSRLNLYSVVCELHISHYCPPVYFRYISSCSCIPIGSSISMMSYT